MQSLACLNHLVTDALNHVPDCLEYLNRIRDPRIFRFCAIPQVCNDTDSSAPVCISQCGAVGRS